MNDSNQSEILSSSSNDQINWRVIATDVLKFWERRRLFYNLALTGVVAYWVISTWPHFKPAMNLIAFIYLLLLAVLANVCYCAAYPIDILLQISAYGARWRRWRWCLLLAGTLLAMALAFYWIGDEIYPAVS